MKSSAVFAFYRKRQGTLHSARPARLFLAASIAELLIARKRVWPVAAVVLFAGALSASATTYTWDSTGTNGVPPVGGAGNWDTANHFTSDNGANYIPWTNLATDDILFKGTGGAVNVAQPITNFLGLKFDVNNYLLSGSSLTSTATTATLNVKDGMSAVINSAISGTNVSIGSSGYSGTLTLGGGNSYTGTTTLNNTAVVKLGAVNALPTTTSLESGTAGSKLDLNGFNQTLVQLASSNQSQSFITNTSATTATLTFTTNSTITASGQTLTGNLNVTKTGTGAWNPAINHTFTGVLTVAGGSMTIATNGNLGAIGQATLTLDGSGANTPELNFSTEAYRAAATFDRAITLLSAGAGTGGRIGSTGVKAVTLSGVISGSGNLRFGTTAFGQGGLILGGSNTYSGLTTIERNEALVAANDSAFGTSSMISQTGANAGTVGFQRSLTNQNINIGAATDITFTVSAQTTGLGSIHNFAGDNSFGGRIILSAGNQIFAAESGSSLLLKGVISGNAFVKRYGGTIALSGANTYTGGTTVHLGTLRLDFSQAGAPSDNIINNVTNSSALTLTGGTLDIKGKASASSQRFNGTTFSAGSSALTTQNTAAGVSVTLGGITRNAGSTVNFVLPSNGSIDTSSGGTSTILLSSAGVAYATVGGDDWAAKASNGTSIVSLATLAPGGPGYTPTTASSLSGNANVAAGVDTTVGTTSNTSTRFGVAEARTITLTGDLTTGGILVASTVGNNASTITGGNLKGPSNASAQDLVVIQNNTANVLTIASTIINNSPNSNFVKSGAGTLELAGTNLYTGSTTITGGVLKLDATGLGLPGGVASTGGTSNLILKGGVLGLQSDFNRTLGSGATQVQFTGDGGFAAYGADRTVTLGTMTWASGSFIPQGSALLLSADDATHTVILAGNIDMNTVSTPQLREIRVANGAAAVDARITGALQANVGILKTGAGTLELAGANTYTGLTQIDGGTLLLTGTLATSTAETTAFSVNNGSTLQIGNNSATGHTFFVNSGTVGFTGAFTYTAKGLNLGGGAPGTTAVVSTGIGTMTVGTDGITYNGHFSNDAGATISGNLSLGAASRTFTVNNSTAVADDLTISAVVSQTSAGIGLTKAGTGTLKLSGANTYTGATTVAAGTLLVSGSIAGAVTVNSGATLGGTGSIVGAVTVNSGATLSPGESPGTLDINSNVTFAAGSTLKLELGGTTPGDGSGFYDQVNMTNAAGSISLTSTTALTLTLQGGFVPQASDIFFVLNRADSVAFSTTFAGAAEGATVDFGNGLTGQITYKANWNFGNSTGALTGGNDVALYNLSVVPEPGAASSLFLGLASLVGLQRFRRRQLRV